MREDERIQRKVMQTRLAVLLLALAILAVPAVALDNDLPLNTTDPAAEMSQEILLDTGMETNTTVADFSSTGAAGDNLTPAAAGQLPQDIGINAFSPTVLPAPRHIFFKVANEAGVRFNWDGPMYGGPDNTYYIKADAGGLNALRITNDVDVALGQVTNTNNQSGVFWITDTGGRGYANNIILLVSVRGPIPDDFALHIRSSGHNWTPAPPGAYSPALPTDHVHVDGAMDETFTREDFIYGPQTWKPGPGDPYVPSLPLYYEQNISDQSNAAYLMFIDLYAGTLGQSKFESPLIDNGAVKVEYNFTNLTTMAAFNGYGWCSASNQGQGISWTNQVFGLGACGYSVVYVPPPPTAFYSANVTAGDMPLTVQFTDTSTGDPTSWAWDFGEGATATEQHPVHTYTTAGTYTVNLTVANDAGSDSEVRTDYITVVSNVKGDFNGDGAVDIDDVAKVAYMVVGKTEANPAADFNENGAVDIGDAAKIAYYFIGKIAAL